MPPPRPTLRVDLSALAANWHLMKSRFSGSECAAVVKADAYGLGALPIAKRLVEEGCRTFFVATVEEGIALRQSLPDPVIYVLLGPACAEDASALHAHQLTPILNSLHQLGLWRNLAEQHQKRLPAALHLDTGMHRLGFPESETQTLIDDPSQLNAIHLQLVMSHLACPDTPEHPLNARQLERFHSLQAQLPAAPRSLVNSAGILLEPEYHYDLARPGATLYGIHPLPNRPRPLKHIATVTAPIAQIRTIEKGESVGYGGTFVARRHTRLATVPVGYADGYFRALSGIGNAAINGRLVPIAGRVSMDFLTFDISSLPEDSITPGTEVELIGPHCTVDDLAEKADTIGYEILTRLGKRLNRIYD